MLGMWVKPCWSIFNSLSYSKDFGKYPQLSIGWVSWISLEKEIMCGEMNIADTKSEKQGKKIVTAIYSLTAVCNGNFEASVKYAVALFATWAPTFQGCAFHESRLALSVNKFHSLFGPFIPGRWRYCHLLISLLTKLLASLKELLSGVSVLTGILLIDWSILSSQCSLLFFCLTKSASGCTLVHLAVIMKWNSIYIYIYIYVPSTFSIIKITSALPSLF